MAVPFNPWEFLGIFTPNDLGWRDPPTPHTDFYGALDRYQVSYLPAKGFPSDTSGQVAILYKDLVLRRTDLPKVMKEKINTLDRAAAELRAAPLGQVLYSASETLRQVLANGNEQTPKPLAPQEMLKSRTETWWGWFVNYLNSYDGTCKDIVKFASDFFYEFSESYRLETDYQFILQKLSDQEVPLHELRNILTERKIRQTQDFSDNPIYQSYLFYVQSLHDYRHLVENARSAVENVTLKKQQEFNFHYAQIEATIANHEGRPRMLRTLMDTLGIPESFFENVKKSRIDPRFNLGLKEKFDDIFTEDYGNLPYVQKYINSRSLYIVLKNPAYYLPEHPVQYFLLYEVHNKDSFPDTFLWKLCTIQGNATNGPISIRKPKLFKRYSLIASDGTYLLNASEERPPECDALHKELVDAARAAKQAVELSLSRLITV